MLNIKPGGIYKIESKTPPVTAALVLVTAVDNTTQTTSVTLFSPDIELGTSDDLLLTPAHSGLTYNLLAQADILGHIKNNQFIRHFGNVQPTALTALHALRNDDTVDHMTAGPPHSSSPDPRWAFKLTELNRIRIFTAGNTCELNNKTHIL